MLDLGSSTVKAGYVFGFPSDDEPRVVRGARAARGWQPRRPRARASSEAPRTARPQITPSAVRMLSDGGAAGAGANGAAQPSTDAHAPAAAGAAGGELRYAVRQGVVQDWDALETVLHHVFYTEVCCRCRRRRRRRCCRRRRSRRRRRCCCQFDNGQKGAGSVGCGCSRMENPSPCHHTQRHRPGASSRALPSAPANGLPPLLDP